MRAECEHGNDENICGVCYAADVGRVMWVYQTWKEALVELAAGEPEEPPALSS